MIDTDSIQFHIRTEVKQRKFGKIMFSIKPHRPNVVALQIPKGETDAEVRSFPRYPLSFIFLPPYHCAFSSVCFFFSYSAAIRKCTECPKTDTLLFALTLVFNDLCFWHGFGKYKGEESQAVRLRNRTAAT